MTRDILINNRNFIVNVAKPLVSGDIQAYKVIMPLNGQACDSVKVTAVKSDGTSVFDVASVSGDNVEYILNSNMYDIEGDMALYLQLLYGDSALTTVVLNFMVIASADEGGAVSDDRYPILTQLIVDISKYNNDLQLHKSATVLDHPNGSVNYAKLADEALLSDNVIVTPQGSFQQVKGTNLYLSATGLLYTYNTDENKMYMYANSDRQNQYKSIDLNLLTDFETCGVAKESDEDLNFPPNCTMGTLITSMAGVYTEDGDINGLTQIFIKLENSNTNAGYIYTRVYSYFLDVWSTWKQSNYIADGSVTSEKLDSTLKSQLGFTTPLVNTEYDTGRKWIDGSSIYRVDFIFGIDATLETGVYSDGNFAISTIYTVLIDNTILFDYAVLDAFASVTFNLDGYFSNPFGYVGGIDVALNYPFDGYCFNFDNTSLPPDCTKLTAKGYFEYAKTSNVTFIVPTLE